MDSLRFKNNNHILECIPQWNVKGIYSKRDEVKYINKYSPAFVSLHETHLS